ncbi:MAG: oligosaccharide flippase family protein [Patescibacteria group bacterium]
MAKLSTDFVWRSLQVYLKEGAVFILFLLAVALLAPAEFGLYGYVGGFAYLFMLLGDFGIAATVAKLIAEERDAGPEARGSVFWNGLLATLAFTVLSLMAAYLLGSVFLAEHAGLLLYALPAIALSPLASFFDGYHRGLREFKALSIVSLAASAAFIIASVFLVLSYGLPGALLAQAAFFGVFVLGALFLRRDIAFTIDRETSRRIVSYALIVGIGTIGYFLYAKIGSVVLGRAGHLIDAANFELAARLLGIAVIMFSVFGQVIAPRMTALRNDAEKLSLSIAGYRKATLLLAVAATVFLAAAITFAIQVFLPAYATGAFFLTFAILASTLPFDLWSVVQRQGILVPLGYAGVMTTGTLVGGAVLLVLAIVLLPFLGAVAVAVATFIARAGTTLWQDRFLRRQLRAA